MNITDRIIKHVYSTDFKDIPEAVINIQKKALIDAVAVSFAASSKGESCGEFIGLAKDLGGAESCVVIGCGFKASPVGAALANGAMAHAMDYEDAHDLSCIHSNAVSTAAALTMADLKRPDVRKGFSCCTDISKRYLHKITDVFYMPVDIPENCSPVIVEPENPKFNEINNYIEKITRAENIDTEFTVCGNEIKINLK